MATESRKGSCYKVCFSALDKLSAPVNLPITTAARMTKALVSADMGPSPLGVAALKVPCHKAAARMLAKELGTEREAYRLP